MSAGEMMNFAEAKKTCNRCYRRNTDRHFKFNLRPEPAVNHLALFYHHQAQFFVVSNQLYQTKGLVVAPCLYQSSKNTSRTVTFHHFL